MAVLRLTRAIVVLLAVLALAGAAAAHHTGHEHDPPPKWSIHATIIEAVSGPWPCSHQRMSTGAPCRYDRAVIIERGELGDVLLTGTKFWMAGERTAGAPSGVHDWGIIAFDPSVGLDQQTALLTIMRAMYPLDWLAFTVAAPQSIEWSENATGASARLAEGSVAELMLAKSDAAVTPPSAEGPRYGAVVRVSRLVEMTTQLLAYREGPQAFDLDNGSGFVLTIDLASDDVKVADEKPTAPN